MATFYITTSIAYANAKPHMGFALELVQADAVARFRRLMGDNVYFLTGTDEHGIKMVQKANDAGITPQQLVDENAAAYKELTKIIDISNDDFIRTTEARHTAGAQKLWRAIAADDGFYKKIYEGLYCVGCEAYVTEKDLIDGNCPIHAKAPIQFKEENYFFRYSGYLPEVKKRIESGLLKITPESRRNEMLSLINAAIAEKVDVSFSRPTSSLAWGVPLPDDPSHNMYVWCDALSNYLTALDYEHDGEKFQKYWPASVHLIGKDILRFHAGLWIAMLIAAKIAPPKEIYVHGYITSEGQKMSKTIGNVVDPFEIVKLRGVDALRYYVLREIPTTDDGDFSNARFHALYDGELADNLGNLVNRVLTMTEKYAAGKVPAAVHDDAILARLLETWKAYQTNMEGFNIKVAIEAVFELLTFMNQYINEKKPWELAKSSPQEVLATLYILLELLRHASLMLLPIIPSAAKKIQDALGWRGDLLYPTNISWGILKEGTAISKGEPLFPKEIA